MIAIVDFGLGNIASVANALKKLEIPYQVSSDADVIKKSKGIILPGDGAAGQGMQNLKKLKLDKIIIEEIQNGKPILGICIGMQLFLDSSEENNTECLGLIKGKVKKMRINLKVPLIGWNNVRIAQNVIARSSAMQNDEAIPMRSPRFARDDGKRLMKNVPDNSYFYFINSYVCVPDDKSIIRGITNYGEEFCSVFEKGNIFGVQFHPEKSGEPGLQMLKNFYSFVISSKNERS